MTVVDIAAALDRRYKQVGAGRGGEQWITIREARSGAGFDGNRGQCDYLAINTWQSHGLQLVGHEIKVAAGDWRRELEQPEKSELFARYCRRWWVVMPSDLARASKPEVPPTWGLLSVSETGRITELVKAPTRDPEPVPVWWWVGWLAQIDRSHKRAAEAELADLVSARVELEREGWEQTWQSRDQYRDRSLDDLARKVDEFEATTGIDIRHSWPHDWRRLNHLWELSQRQRVPGFGVLAGHLREMAVVLDGLDGVS